MMIIIGLIILTVMGLCGVALLRHFAAFLDPLESIAYGVPLGLVLASLFVLIWSPFN